MAAKMGAWHVEGEGVSFRVWAPKVEKVFVCGEWMDAPPKKWGSYSKPDECEGTELNEGDNGIFTICVADAKPGQKYCFYLKTGNKFNRAYDPYGRHLSGPYGQKTDDEGPYDLVEVPTEPPPSCESPPPLNTWVIYQIHPMTFPDEKSDVPFEEQVINQMSLIGANALQLMPHTAAWKGECKGGGPGDMRTWGYDPVSMFSPDPMEFTPESLKKLIAKAHENNFVVIFDHVPNHVYKENAWTAWSKLGDEEKIFWTSTAWGPQYSLKSPRMRDYLCNSLEYWFDEFNFDAVRIDAPVALWGEKPEGDEADKCVAEFWKRYTEVAGKRGKNLFPENGPKDDKDLKVFQQCLDDYNLGGCWYSNFVRQVFNLLGADEGDVGKCFHKFLDDDDRTPNSITFLENHDKASDQQLGRLAGSFPEQKCMLGAALLFTLPGVPLIFQGQEVLNKEAFKFMNPPRMDWELCKKNTDVLNQYRLLIFIHKNLVPADAKYEHVSKNFEEKQHFFWKYWRGDVAVAINYTNEESKDAKVDVPNNATYKAVYPPDLLQKGDKLQAAGKAVKIDLPPLSLVILAPEDAAAQVESWWSTIIV